MNELIGIDDGYTGEHYIAAHPGAHVAVRFKARPMLPTDRAALIEKMKSMSARDALRLCVRELEKRLVEWDVADDSGDRLSITQHNLLRLEPRLLDRIRNVAMALDVGDPDPESDDDKPTLLVDESHDPAKNSAAE